MKKNWFRYLALITATTIIGTTTFAQKEKDNSSTDKDDKTQEIVIRKKGGKTDKMTIVVDGDNVTINGKPVEEFKNNDVTVFKRDRAISMSPGVRGFAAPHPPYDVESLNGLTAARPMNKAMLGVMTEKGEDGVKVREVTPESGADKAGLKKDDVITKVGDKDVKEPADLISAMGAHKPNDKVDITYKRDGKVNKTTVTLGENKARVYSYNFNNRGFNNRDFNFEMPELAIPPMENFNFNFNRKPKIGLQIEDVETGKGVTVKDVDNDSPAAKAGLKDGDIITGMNGKDVSGVDELRNLVKDIKEGETVKLSYKRNGKNETAEIKIPKRLKTADL